MSRETELLSCHAANVSVEIQIQANLATTWLSMVEQTSEWWRGDFLICENSKGMKIDPRVGGLVAEIVEGEGCGFAWGQIISFQPNSHFAYVAQIVPPWGGPAQSVVQISLEPIGDESTRLTLTDSIIGHLSDDLVASLDEGCRQLFGEGGLKGFVESKAV